MPGPIPRTVAKAARMLRSEAESFGECMLVNTRHVKGAGHPVISVMGKHQSAHRVIWEDSNGPIPEGQCVLHTCDRPRCVNINHLFLGDRRDNMLDMWEKKRGVVGDAHPNAQFSEDDVRYIRDHTEISGAEFGRLYGVSPNTIYAIRARRSWAHVD